MKFYTSSDILVDMLMAIAHVSYTCYQLVKNKVIFITYPESFCVFCFFGPAVFGLWPVDNSLIP